MSTTIDSLDIQISTSLGQSEQKLQALADALGELKNQGKIGAATSAMKSLAKALDVLNPSLNALNPAKLQQLRAAMNGLSNIQKASGLSSSVNTLKKIPEVLNSLDDTTLVKMDLQMRKLAKAISPLAQEMDKIGNAFSKLPPRVSQVVTATNKLGAATKKATAATKEHSDALDHQSVNLMSAIYNFNEIISAVQMVGDMLHATMAQAMEWDGIQYRFGRAFGEDAEEVYAYAQKINEIMGINIQQFMQYSSLYGSLLSGFGMAQEKVTTISVGLTELSYDIWAAYNDRFKSLEDASEAVRSAITGEIEPIRNAGIALTEASLQEYLDQVGMAEISIEKLSEAQKAEVRYAAMMNAALNQGIVGTYASEMQTAEGAVRNLSQAFKGLVQAFGSLFIPILQIAIPYLTAFVNLLYEAVAAIAAFFGISFFEIDWGGAGGGVSDMAAGLEDAAGGAGDVESGLGGAAKAAKKIKDYMMGFDELNVIEPPKENSGGGGGGAGGGGGVDWEGLDLETLWDESVFAKATKQVDELKQKIKDWFAEWKTEIAIIGGALAALTVASLLEGLGRALHFGEGFLTVMGKIKKVASTAIIITLQYALMSEFLGNFIEEGSWKDYIAALIVGAIGTGILYSMWGPAGLIIGLGVTAVASFKAVFENGGITDMESATVAFTGLASAIGAIAIGAKMLKGTNIGAAFELLKEGNTFKSVLGAMFPTAARIATAASTWVTGTLVPTITSAITTGLGAVATALGVSTGWAAAIVAAVIAAIVGVIWAATHWDQVTEFFTETVPEWFSGVKDAVSEWWSKFDLGKIVRKAMGKAKDWFSGIRDDVNEYWDGVIQDIKDIDWAGAGYEMGQKVGTAFKNAKEWFAGIGTAVKEFFTEDLPEFFTEDVPKFFTETIPETIESIKESWNTFWKEKVPELLADLAAFFLVELPTWKKEMEEIGTEIIMGILTGIKDSWNEFWKGVGEWIDGFVQGFKDALEINSPSKVFKRIGEYIVSGLMGGISAKWEDLKRWYRTNIAPKFTLAFWSGVFANVKQGAAEKLEETKKKISEKWGDVKSWYQTNVAPKFTLQYWKDVFVNIYDGLKEKLDDAWDKVKEFFDVSEWKKKVVDVIDEIKKNFVLPEFPKIKLEVTYSTNVGAVKKAVYEALGLPGWPSLKWKAYAQGGWPSMGEAFIARENGPELVGRIGNRTAVANNDQIVEAVSRGVYSAVVAAMSAGNGGNGQNVNVYLDGKQIYASVKRVEAERGVSIMGNQLGYAY